MLYGSMCLNAASSGAALRPFPGWAPDETATFHHTPHPQRGLVEILTHTPAAEIHLPQRSKSYSVYVDAHEDWTPEVHAYFTEQLPKMESQHEQARQLYKLNQYQKELKRYPKCSSFNIMLVNNGDHGHVGILSQWSDLFLLGVYDSVNSSVRLVWTDDEYFVTDLRQAEGSRYVFYRFPVLSDRPLFMYTQALCSKWHSWSLKFKNEPDSALKAFNALETLLYKEPELPTLTKLSNSNGRPS